VNRGRAAVDDRKRECWCLQTVAELGLLRIEGSSQPASQSFIFNCILSHHPKVTLVVQQFARIAATPLPVEKKKKKKKKKKGKCPLFFFLFLKIFFPAIFFFFLLSFFLSPSFDQSSPSFSRVLFPIDPFFPSPFCSPLYRGLFLAGEISFFFLFFLGFFSFWRHRCTNYSSILCSLLAASIAFTLSCSLPLPLPLLYCQLPRMTR